MTTIDIVVPCYNEQEVLTTFHKETQAVIDAVSGDRYVFRFLFVNDGSRDDTLVILKGLKASYDNVGYISFSRNFGKEPALYAGLKHSTGDYVIVMDADLQHPPTLFAKFIESIEAGHDCCAAYREKRSGEKAFRGAFSKMFYRFNNRITETKLPYGATDYRIMSRQVVDSIVSLPEIQRFSKGLFAWVGFDTQWVPYEDVQRTLGNSKWSFRSLFKYALDGLFAFTVKPLKFIAVIGFVISAIAIIYGLFILIHTLVVGIDSPGYASTIVILLFLGGIIELSIGILGEYIARIYTEIKKRPIYLAKEVELSDKDTNDEKTT